MKQYRPSAEVDYVIIGSGAAGGIMAKQLSTAGFSVVVLEQGGWTLRVAIDLPLDEHTDPHEVPSDRVDLEDCENMSRELSAVLDVEDPIPQAFSLEVSSPGIERPLRVERDYVRFTGQKAKLKLRESVSIPTKRLSKPSCESALICHSIASFWSRNHQPDPNWIFPGHAPS